MESKKKILIVVPNDVMGGAEGILKMIALHFLGDNVDVKFLTKSKADSWQITGNNINISHTSAATEYVGAFKLFFSFLFRKKVKYDYVFTSHVFVTGLVGLMVRLGIVKKTFFIGRESTLIFKRFTGFKLSLYKLMYKWGYPAVDLLICQTEHMKEELLKALPDIENITKVVFLPNPIDLDAIKMKTDSPMAENYGRFIVSGGRLIPEKGFDLLINAFKKLKEDYTDFKLVIVGEGRERQGLEELIKSLNLHDEVILKGFVSNVYPYFKAAGVCVVSSRIEGFPNILLQMMSQNTKVVSTKCAGGIDEIKGICIAEVNDLDSLYHAIKKALAAGDSDKRATFDIELKNRSIESFVKKIQGNLNLL